MSNYTNINVNISDGQKEKLKKALATGNELSVRFLHTDLVGNDIIGVTQLHLNRLNKAHETGKGITIKGVWSKRRQTKTAKVKTATGQNGD